MYRWFNRITRISNAKTEPPLTIEKDETLWCTPRGQVAELRPRAVFDFTRERSRALRSERPKLGIDGLRAAVRSALRLPVSAASAAPDFRILRPAEGRRYPKPHAGNYAVETEPGVFAIVYRLDDQQLLSRPPRGTMHALLYVSHQSADAELRGEAFTADLMKAEPDSPVFACDVRGAGESLPGTCGVDPHSPYGGDYFYAIHSFMLDRPILGQRTFDVLRIIWPLSLLLPEVLRHFDLPDCYRALEAKRLRLIEPWGPEAP